MNNYSVKVTLTLRLAAAATAVIGLITLIAPREVVAMFDGYHGNNLHFVRFIGTALIGFAVMNWMYSMASDLRVVIPAILGNITSLALAIAVDALGLINGMLAPTAWIILMVHAGFLAAFSYCLVALHRQRRPL